MEFTLNHCLDLVPEKPEFLKAFDDTYGRYKGGLTEGEQRNFENKRREALKK